MAHHKSAVKRIRRNKRANVRNSQYLTSVRTAIKKFRVAAAATSESGKAELGTLFVAAQAKLAKAAAKGVLHKNNASRRIGRLAALLKTAGTAAATAGEKKTAGAKKTASTAAKKAAPKKK